VAQSNAAGQLSMGANHLRPRVQDIYQDMGLSEPGFVFYIPLQLQKIQKLHSCRGNRAIEFYHIFGQTKSESPGYAYLIGGVR